MTPEKALKIGASTAQALLAAKDGNPAEAARHAMDAVLEAIPADEARRLLDERAIARANARADELENEFFGPPDRQG